MTNEENQSEENKKKMPTWAKVLIVVVIVAIVGVIALCIGGAVFMQNLMKQAQDPASIIKIANDIGAFPNKLSEDYKFTMGLDLAGVKTIVIEHDQDKQMLIVTSFPIKDTTDPQALVDQLYEKGVNIPQAKAQFDQVKSKGTETVAGLPMPYIIGAMKDQAGNHFEGMVGCIVSQKKNATLLIYGIQPPGSAYNFKATQDLLKQVKNI